MSVGYLGNHINLISAQTKNIGIADNVAAMQVMVSSSNEDTYIMENGSYLQNNPSLWR